MDRTGSTNQQWIVLGLGGVLAAWAGGVIVGATTGALGRIGDPRAIGAMVAATIVVPAVLYALSPDAKLLADRVGLFRLTVFHAWRMPAGLLFFWLGGHGALPQGFWIPSGLGDFVAGALGMTVLWRRPNAAGYWVIQGFGLADLVLAVGLGMMFALGGDPRMAPVTELPLALIPLFGVGVSVVAHLIAFDLLRRRTA